MLLTRAMLGAVFLGVAMAEAGEPADTTRDGAVRDAWLPTVPEIVHWHWEKDRHGPAFTGNRSWQHHMAFLERQLADAGVVDLTRNRWQFQRWQTSHWPDDSRWSLSVDGRAVEVASFGANSGATPAQGVTAPLVLYEPGDPPEGLAGRIAVLRTRLDPAQAAALAQTDYEYRSDPAPYPWKIGELPADAAPGADSVSWQIFPQLMQTPGLIDTLRGSGAAGAVIVFDAGREQMAGLYTFPVPDHYDVPTLLLDREAGADVIEAARAGARATLRLEAQVKESEAYQVVGFLPGRHYGTPQDEMIQLVTHTDGPSVSQDNGALGILGVVRYFAQVPRKQRRRTLMVFLDGRHFMPGQEEAFAAQNYFARNPAMRERIATVVAMEHLGQIDYREDGHRLLETGRVGTSLIWTTDHPALLELTIDAVQDNALPGAEVRNVARPGIHGRNQGAWYGMASPARAGGLPAVAIMGPMGGYWSTSAGVERLDPILFRRQLAAFVQITGALMARD